MSGETIKQCQSGQTYLFGLWLSLVVTLSGWFHLFVYYYSTIFLATTKLSGDKPIPTNVCGYISSNKERVIIRSHWMLLTNSFQTMKESVVVVIVW